MHPSTTALLYQGVETKFRAYEGRIFNENYRAAFEELIEETRREIFKTHCNASGLTQDATNIYSPSYSVLQNADELEEEDIDEFVGTLPSYESYIRTTFSVEKGHDPNVAEGILYLSDEAAQREFDAVITEYNSVVESLKNEKKYKKLISYYQRMATLLGR